MSMYAGSMHVCMLGMCVLCEVYVGCMYAVCMCGFMSV